MDTLLRDLRQAVRALRAHPGFTVVAVLTLALGIGASGAIFSVLDAVLLRPLPYRAPHELVMLHEREVNPTEDPNFPVAPANLRDWQARADGFTAMAGYSTANVLLTGGAPERLSGAFTGGSLFSVLGVTPALGRAVSPDDDVAGAPPVAVISHRLWQRRFGGDPSVIGTSLTLDGTARTIVGVAEPGFRFPDAEVDVWMPLQFGEEAWQNRGGHNLRVVARLAPGQTVEGAASRMSELAAVIARENPEFPPFGATAIPLTEELVGDVRPTLLVLGGAVMLLVLIACANVANLLLARAAGRRREMAVRAAIGASRRDVIRQLLVESLGLAAVAGALGVLLAVWGTDALVRLAPVDLPRLDEAAVNVRSLVFTAALALGTGVLFGLAPALQASKVQLTEALKEGTRGSSVGRGQSRTRTLLLVGEVALSLMLLVGAGLLLRSFFNMQAVDPGFRPENMITARVSLPPTRYETNEQRMAFLDRLLEETRAVPGVRTATVSNSLPMSGGLPIMGFWIDGRPYATPADTKVAALSTVDADFFPTLAMPLRRGRRLTAADRADAAPVMLVNEAMAREHFPGENPIGLRVRPGDPEGTEYEIVGVVGDVRQFSLTEAPQPQMYLPLAQAPFIQPSVRLIVRAERDPERVVPAVRDIVKRLDADVPLSEIRPMTGVLADQLSRTRFTMVLLTAFAGVALVLAVIGMYGVIAYSVAQRTQEFGIRMALGASRRRVLGQVVSEALRTTGLGLAVGVVGVLALGQLVGSLLFGVQPSDPLTVGSLTVLVTVIALSASTVPALRATRVAPSHALRND